MDFNLYQQETGKTSIIPKILEGKMYYISIGLAGEVGELLNKIKKVARDNKNIDKNDMKKELGDILWYLSQLAKELDLNLDEIAEYNLLKLQDREKRNVLGGSGDNR